MQLKNVFISVKPKKHFLINNKIFNILTKKNIIMSTGKVVIIIFQETITIISQIKFFQEIKIITLMITVTSEITQDKTTVLLFQLYS